MTEPRLTIFIPRWQGKTHAARVEAKAAGALMIAAMIRGWRWV